MLRSSSSDLIAVRGFLTQLMGAWEGFRSKILQQSTQVSSVLIEEVKHSSEELEKIREEKEHLTQQLTEQRRQREEQLSQQEDAEKEHKKKLLRLKEELEEKHERWLSCQQKCDTIQEQLLLWQQREEQMNQRCSAAEEEVTRLGKALEKVQQETRELRRQREILIESHGRVLTKMEEDSRHQIASKLAAALEEQRTQNALHLKQQMEKFRSDLELELVIDREKNQLLLLQYQQDSTQLQQKVVLLQETVRRECEEREELTAALCKAQEELLGLRSQASHHGSSSSPPSSMERRTPSTNKHFNFHNQTRMPLTRSSTSPNTLRPFLACTDMDRSRDTDRRGAVRSLDSWNCNRVLGGEIKQEGTLPGVKASSTVNKVKHKVSLVMERKARP
ncbi:golgin subfamily A member 6-like protein 22 isoform X2 [Mastacembelus armatus]|uniref:golgin subfamily A member 6-like protein 22 isoform X2 n=1 Tax=Mastacembelus armatus TaxID=205130 RepID=UPI000E462FA8|nr:golgin subfamily A member 6-like protein 22 isoform X2 [Mastacembelus armatus]